MWKARIEEKRRGEQTTNGRTNGKIEDNSSRRSEQNRMKPRGMKIKCVFTYLSPSYRRWIAFTFPSFSFTLACRNFNIKVLKFAAWDLIVRWDHSIGTEYQCDWILCAIAWKLLVIILHGTFKNFDVEREFFFIRIAHVGKICQIVYLATNFNEVFIVFLIDSIVSARVTFLPDKVYSLIWFTRTIHFLIELAFAVHLRDLVKIRT